MSDKYDTEQKAETRHWTLLDLLLAIVFFEPVIAVTVGVEQAGGGALRYGDGVFLACASGTLLVVLNWNFAKMLGLRSAKYSETIQKAIGIAFLALELVWILLVIIVGDQLASLLIRQVA